MKKRSISLIAAAGLAAAGLAVAANSAQAGQVLPCQYHAHACVAALNTTGGNVHSIRVNGQCLLFRSAGSDHYFPNVAVSYNETPTTLTYSGYRCEGKTQNWQTVEWDQTTGAGNYRWVKLSFPYTPHEPIG